MICETKAIEIDADDVAKQSKPTAATRSKAPGPTSEAGKERSRRNAVRHRLTAETVIESLEDPDDYKHSKCR